MLTNEDFSKQIESIISTHGKTQVAFFSGYDCDSLALEPITHFFSIFMKNLNLPKNALIELRTKSTQINFLLERKVIQSFLIAFSFF